MCSGTNFSKLCSFRPSYKEAEVIMPSYQSVAVEAVTEYNSYGCLRLLFGQDATG